MKLSIPCYIVAIAVIMTFSLVSCNKEDPDKDTRKKADIAKEKTEEEVKY